MLRKLYTIFLPILVVTTLLFLPIFFKPEIFLSRGNDLEEFFWPIYYFAKQSVLKTGLIPFWFPHILSGIPLLPDPQSGIFYPPNIIFLVMPLGAGFVVSSFLHIFAGGLAMYALAKRGFKFNHFSSLLAASLYIMVPKLAAAMEAGHFGIIQAHAWLPLIPLAVVTASPILLAVSLAGVFFTHATTFMYASIAAALFFLLENFTVKKAFRLGIGAVIAFGLIAIAFLPQLSWLPQTNREFLLNNPQVYPIWTSKIEFVKTIFTSRAPETEKAITLGIIPIFLALIGFFHLSNKNKMKIGLASLPILLISLNNASPLYNFFLSQKWYVMGRVATRIWFVIIFITVLLAAYGLEKIKKFKKLILLLALAETLFISWSIIGKPINKPDKYVGNQIYEFLEKDKGNFRVFCINRCIPQKEAVKRNLYLIEGYSTLISKDYISMAWQMTGVYWNHYSLALPPFGFYDSVVPDPVSLGQQGTKYIISPKKIDNPDLELKVTTDKYFVYSNQKFVIPDKVLYDPPKSYQIGKLITFSTVGVILIWLYRRYLSSH